MTLNLDERLSCAASFVRRGKRFADIGSDHAYLPIYLAQRGMVDSALASDINEGPVESAIRNINTYGVCDKVSAICSDGLAGARDFAPEDIAILGMGGELIADIIDKAPFLKDKSVRLILQPMSRQGQLRLYLLTNGFSIIKEVYSYSQGKYYVTICAEYTGQRYEPSLYERELGRAEFLDTGCAECQGYLNARLRVYEKIARGKRTGGKDECDEALLYQYIKNLRKDI